MIRRSPTLIPMTDVDVQDVRDLVAKQRADTQAHHKAMARMKRLAEKQVDEEDVQWFAQLKDVVSGIKASREREARLAKAQPGPSTAIAGGTVLNDLHSAHFDIRLELTRKSLQNHPQVERGGHYPTMYFLS